MRIPIKQRNSQSDANIVVTESVRNELFLSIPQRTQYVSLSYGTTYRNFQKYLGLHIF